MIMKVKKRYWVTAAIATSLVSGALIVNAWTKASNSHSQQNTNKKMMSRVSVKMPINFEFEDYKTAEAAQDKLNSLFPKGANIDEFKKQMHDLGADCYDPELHKEGQFVACHYREKSFSLFRPWWFIKAELDDNNRIDAIEVERGVTAP